MDIVVGILIGLGVVVLGILMIVDPGDWLVQNMKLPNWLTRLIGVLVVIGGIILGLYIAGVFG